MDGEGTTGSKWFWWVMGIVAAVVAAAIITALHLNSSSGGSGGANSPDAPAVSSAGGGKVPSVAQEYSGQLQEPTNFWVGLDLCSVQQNGSKLSGTMKIQGGAFGSGSFTGAITSAGEVDLTVTPSQGGFADNRFQGHLAPSGEISGTYTDNSHGTSGNWIASQASDVPGCA